MASEIEVDIKHIKNPSFLTNLQQRKRGVAQINSLRISQKLTVVQLSANTCTVVIILLVITLQLYKSNMVIYLCLILFYVGSITIQSCGHNIDYVGINQSGILYRKKQKTSSNNC